MSRQTKKKLADDAGSKKGQKASGFLNIMCVFVKVSVATSHAYLNVGVVSALRWGWDRWVDQVQPQLEDHSSIVLISCLRVES